MKLCIVGGKLQGIEATYLAKKAGYNTTLIDKDSKAPALSLSDNSYIFDVTDDPKRAKKIYSQADAVIPATENRKTLQKMKKDLEDIKVPFLHDSSAYDVSSSKIKSQKLFQKLGISTPKKWPKSNLPVVIKPSSSSGSEGVIKVNDIEKLKTKIGKMKSKSNELVIEEFIDGPSISIEIISINGENIPLIITQLEFDEIYDCKRVFAPSQVSEEAKKQFRAESGEIAGEINLKGLTDVEAMVKNNNPFILEIDARLPSQTPVVVFNCSGLNIINLICDIFVKEKLPSIQPRIKNAVIYEHLKMNNGCLSVRGEHIMTEANKLRFEENFFGADEAITNYSENKSKWVATIIVKEKNLQEAWKKRNNTIEKMKKKLQISKYYDSEPGE